MKHRNRQPFEHTTNESYTHTRTETKKKKTDRCTAAPMIEKQKMKQGRDSRIKKGASCCKRRAHHSTFDIKFKKKKEKISTA